VIQSKLRTFEGKLNNEFSVQTLSELSSLKEIKNTYEKFNVALKCLVEELKPLNPCASTMAHLEESPIWIEAIIQTIKRTLETSDEGNEPFFDHFKSKVQKDIAEFKEFMPNAIASEENIIKSIIDA
jgi:hypothetical protein